MGGQRREQCEDRDFIPGNKKDFRGTQTTIELPEGVEENSVFQSILRTEREKPLENFMQDLNALFLSASEEEIQAAKQSGLALQQECLHILSDANNPSSKIPIETSIIPAVIEDEAVEQVKDSVEVIGLAKRLVMLAIYGCEDLDIQPAKGLLEYLSGHGDGQLDPIVLEIMESQQYDPVSDSLRWRMDTFSKLNATKAIWVKIIEDNGGEPQGDQILSAAIQVIQEYANILAGISPQETGIALKERPSIQVIEYMTKRYNQLIGAENNELPVIGYLAWRGRSSLSNLEAQQSAETYEKEYGGRSVSFDPLDIIDIRLDKNGLCKIVIEREGQQYEVDMIRRLHGEPMENVDLWEQLKKLKPEVYYKLIGKYHSEHNPSHINPQTQMFNSFNSWATSKGLDAVLSDLNLRAIFGIDNLMESLFKSSKLMEALGVSNNQLVRNPHTGEPTHLTAQVMKDYITHSLPETYALRRRDELIEGETSLGLTAEEIQTIKKNRSDWVIKIGTLLGHSGEGVHVGSGIYPYELSNTQIEEALEDTKFQYLLNSSEGQLQDTIKYFMETAGSETVEQLKQIAWEYVVEHSLNVRDAIIMRRVEPTPINYAVINDSGLEPRRGNVDINPQMINGRMSHIIGRVSGASKTNITGGYGALIGVISREAANKMVAYIKYHKTLNESSI